MNKTKKNPYLKDTKRLPLQKQGWLILHIHGNAHDRGFSHGTLLKNELQKVLTIFPFVVKREKKIEITEYLEKVDKLITPNLIQHFPEIYNELKGISLGSGISLDFLIGWNAYCCMDYKEKCSAFIASGNFTKKGDIIMAHNTHSDFFTGELLNIILYITPEKGFPFVMQTSAGLVWSTTDWFLSKSGIIGCETTIADINYKPDFLHGDPLFCRIRMAIQYGESLDDYISIMLKNNAGDYACSWLFANIKNGEIMRFEIGKKIHNVERTFNGVYYGMNSPFDPILREKETNNHDFYNIKTSSGMRNQRLNYLLNDKYFGKITIHSAKKIISDHVDLSNKSIGKPNNNTICKHSEIVPPKFKLFGTTDGKVTSTELAKNLNFFGRFGSACGKRNFSVKNHSKYKHYLRDIHKWNWTLLSIGEKN